MTWLHRLLLRWFRPADPAPVPRVRRLRATCPGCGKDIAVIASSGMLWHHTCGKPEAPPLT